jgi:hypothetical protein
MTNRIFGDPNYLTEATGETYTGGTGIEDSQVLPEPNGHNYAPNDVHDYHNAGPKRSVMSEEPGLFNTAKHKQTKTVASYAAMPQISSPVANGSGYLLGYAVSNPTATAVTVSLSDGWDSSGVDVINITVPPNDSKTFMFPFPIRYRLALYYSTPNSTTNTTIYLEDKD